MMKLFMVFRALSVSLKTVMSSSIDLVSSIDGYHGDSAVTIPIGHVKPDVMKLLKVTEESLFKGIEQVKVGNRIGAIGHAVQNVL